MVGLGCVWVHLAMDKERTDEMIGYVAEGQERGKVVIFVEQPHGLCFRHDALGKFAIVEVVEREKTYLKAWPPFRAWPEIIKDADEIWRESHSNEALDVLNVFGLDRGGVSLVEQVLEFEKSMRPWPKPKVKKKEAKCVGESPGYSSKILRMTVAGLRKASSLATLQRELVIYNVNEFKLRNLPTPEEFNALLNDFERWEKRSWGCFIGTKAEIELVRILLDRTLEIARKKYKRLYKKVAD